MYLKIMEFSFLGVALILTFLLFIRELGVTKKMSPMRASDFVSSMAGLMFGYVILAFLLALFLKGIQVKFTMALFGLMPFIIGKIVTYKKVHFYSIIQIVCIIVSIVYVISL